MRHNMIQRTMMILQGLLLDSIIVCKQVGFIEPSMDAAIKRSGYCSSS